MTDERDWAGSNYVRVYQSIRTDEKFKTIYEDDRALAAWLRLLLEADSGYPAPSSIPAGLGRHARTVLTAAGVLRAEGRTYTLSGLAKERQGRAMTGAERSSLWRERHRNGAATGRDVSPVTTGATPRAGAGASVSVYEGTSSSLTEESPERNPLSDAIDYIEARTRRLWSFGVGSKPWETLTADVRDFGWPAVRSAMDALTAPFPDVGQLVFGASNRLHVVEKAPTTTEPDPEWVKSQLAERRKGRTAHA